MAKTFQRALATFCVIGGAALASSAFSPLRADPAAGEAIAQKGLPKVAPCSICHGPKGEGKREVAPRLAGLSKAYILGQLNEFRAGTRKNATMQGVGSDLTPAQSEDVADYFSSVTAPSQPLSAPADVVKTGQRIAEQGLPSAGVPACVTCHGPGGIGVAPSVPYLAGGQIGYVQRQIQAFKAGRRADPTGLMKPVAMKLSDEDAYAVASYFASLSAPKAQGKK